MKLMATPRDINTAWQLWLDGKIVGHRTFGRFVVSQFGHQNFDAFPALCSETDSVRAYVMAWVQTVAQEVKSE